MTDTADPESTGRTLIVMHTSQISGPAKSFSERLPLTTREGERVVLFPEDGPAVALFSGACDVRFADYSVLHVPNGASGVLRLLLKTASDVVHFFGFFRARQIDTVVSGTTYTPAVFIAARLARKRTIIYCGELLNQTDDDRIQKRAFSRLLVAAARLCADRIICCSELVEKQFGSTAKTRVVYPSISVDSLKSRRRERKLLEPITCTVIGTLSPGRGQEIAAAAVIQLAEHGLDVSLEIAGSSMSPADHEYAENLMDLSRRHPQVHLLGSVADLGALLERTDIIINPAEFDEPFGRVAYEALAAGCPVVITTTGASTELLSSSAVKFVPPGNARAIADAVANLAANPHQITGMIAEADRMLPTVSSGVTNAQWVSATTFQS